MWLKKKTSKSGNSTFAFASSTGETVDDFPQKYLGDNKRHWLKMPLKCSSLGLCPSQGVLRVGRAIPAPGAQPGPPCWPQRAGSAPGHQWTCVPALEPAFGNGVLVLRVQSTSESWGVHHMKGLLLCWPQKWVISGNIDKHSFTGANVCTNDALRVCMCCVTFPLFPALMGGNFRSQFFLEKID